MTHALVMTVDKILAIFERERERVVKLAYASLFDWTISCNIHSLML